MNYDNTKAESEGEIRFKNKSAEMENKYGRTAAVGDKLKAVPIAKGLAEVSKSKTVQHRRAKARPQELVGLVGWTGLDRWDWRVDRQDRGQGQLRQQHAPQSGHLCQKSEDILNDNRFLNMDKLAKKEREKLKCSKAVSIGKGLVV